MKRPTAMMIAACISTSLAVHGAMVAGAQKKEWAPNPKRHTISIVRDAANETEKKMIGAAERARPLQGVWWVEKDGEPVMTLGHKTLRAATKGALDYYTAKVKEYQSTKWHSYGEPRSSVVYKATIQREATRKVGGRDFKNVYVVSLDLTFNIALVNSSGGTTMKKTRIVVLDSKGVPQSIEGDGDESFPVWMH